MIFSSKKIHHFAFAVNNFETSSYYTFVSLLGAKLKSSGVVESEGVRVHMIELSEDSPLLEVISPLGENSKIDNFLKRKGEGFHHVCYQVSDLRLEQGALALNNISFLDGYPKKGYQDNLIAFLNPKQTNGLLIELKE